MSRRRYLFLSLGRHLAVLALFSQLMAPVALSARPGLDIAGFLCAPLGTLSAEARAEAEALIGELLGQTPDDERNTPHCPFCVLVHGVLLPEYVATPAIRVGHQEAATCSFESSVVYRPHGPPLGLRAPPSISL